MAYKTLATALVALTLCGALLPGCSRRSSPASIQDRATSFFQAGEYDKARVEYQNLLRAQPGSPLAVKRLGLIWMEQGNPVQAYGYLAKARKSDERDLAVRQKLAAACLSLNRTVEARTEAAAILEMAPSDEEALLLLAETATKDEEKADVEQRLKTLAGPETAAAHLARAVLLLKKSDAAGATTEIDQARALDPRSAHAQSLLASVAAARKDPTAARAALKAAADLSPPRAPAKIRYADYLRRTGAVAEAKAFIEAMSKEKPDYLPAWELQAQIAFQENRLDDCLALCANIFARDPVSFNARLLESRALLAKGDARTAITRLETLGKSYTNAPLIDCQLARAYLQDGKVPQASATLTRALTAQPGFLDAILLQAEVNLRSGDARSSIPQLERVMKKLPGHGPAELLLAECYRGADRVADALAIYRRRVASAPQDAGMHLLLGATLRQAHQPAEARAEFARVLELAPATRPARVQMVELEMEEGKFTEARQHLEPMLQPGPDFAAGQYLLARTYFAEKSWSQAETALQKVLQTNPSSVPAAELLVSTYLAAKKTPEAIAQLTALTAREPNRPGPYLSLGAIFEQTNQPEHARDVYEKLITLQPENAPVLNNLACLYLGALKDPAKGYELAKRARAQRPGDPAIADTFGWALYQRRDYPAALAALEEAAKKIGDLGEIQYHLGMTQYALGAMEPARAAFTKALAAKAPFAGREEVERRLALIAQGDAAELPVDELEALAQKQPGDTLPLLRLADAYEKRREYPKAEATLQRALQQNPQLVPALVKLSQLYLGPLAQGTKALEPAKKARAMQPNDPVIAALHARAVYATGKVAYAYSLLQESARRLPNDAALLYDFASAAYECGKVAEAERTLARLQEEAITPESAERARTFQGLLIVERERQNLQAAAPQVQALLAQAPAFTPALMVQAVLELVNGQPAKAIGIYTSLLDRLPEFTPAQLRLGTLYADDPAHLSQAYTLAVKAHAAWPDDASAARLLGKVCYLKKDYPQVRSVLQQAGESASPDAPSLFYLGMSHLQGGDRAQAKERLEQALAAHLEEPKAAEARAALASLSPK